MTPFALLIVALATSAFAAEQLRPCVRIKAREVTKSRPPLYGAVYSESQVSRLINTWQASDDNGGTWQTLPLTPNFMKGLPRGYRRAAVAQMLDARQDRLLTIVNALDTPELAANVTEPLIAQKNYYLRYRVSTNGGRSWLFDEPIIQKDGDFDAKHPLEGVWIGKNAIYLGDRGCIPIVTRNGKVLVPAQTTPLGKDGRLQNPSGGYTFTDVVVLIGTWMTNNRLEWEVSSHIQGDPERTTRGLCEPTIIEAGDGRLLLVLRGSNGGQSDPNYQLPSHKWASISEDGGFTWSKPEPWKCDDGQSFFSPSSMSVLFKHSSGRILWTGNLTPENAEGSLPRFPLVIGEVDVKTLRLIRSSLVTLDAEQLSDKEQGRLDLSHVHVREDRETQEIIVTYPRAHNAYKNYEWMLQRLALQ